MKGLTICLTQIIPIAAVLKIPGAMLQRGRSIAYGKWAAKLLVRESIKINY